MVSCTAHGESGEMSEKEKGNGMKTTKVQIENLKQFIARSENGVMKSSDWTNGSGNYVTAKALPPHVAKEWAAYAKTEAGKAFAKAHPRVKFILVCDLQAANETLEQVTQ